MRNYIINSSINPLTPPSVERARPSALSSCPLNFFLIMLQSIYPAVQKSFQACQPTNQQPASQPDRQPAACNLLVIGPPFGLVTPLTPWPASQPPARLGYRKTKLFDLVFYFIFKRNLEPLWTFILTKILKTVVPRQHVEGSRKLFEKTSAFGAS